jgi:hypothetical protein
MKTRFGPGRPAVAHETVQGIDLPSSHSQLRGKVAGKLSGGLKLIEFSMELSMPAASDG